MATWSYVRDVMELTPHLAAEVSERLSIQQPPITPGSTLAFIGRDVRVLGDFTLPGYDVLVAADRFDGSQGTLICSSNISGGNGPDGTFAGASGQAGGAGGRGDNVTVFCKDFSGIKVTSTGGDGGPGGNGVDGRNGGPGGSQHPDGFPGDNGGGRRTWWSGRRGWEGCAALHSACWKRASSPRSNRWQWWARGTGRSGRFRREAMGAPSYRH
jgi:hypothetical protein